MQEWVVATGLACAALLPAAAQAQQGPAPADSRCAYVAPRYQIFGRGTPTQATYLAGGVTFDCPDGRLIKADSVVMLTSGDQRLLIGHAYYADGEKVLTADRINYLGAQQHMTAQKGPTDPTVTLVDRVNGATIRGDFMDYSPAQNGQESHTTIYSSPGGVRPHAVLHAKTQSAARGQSAAPGTATGAVETTTAAADSSGASATAARGDTAVAALAAPAHGDTATAASTSAAHGDTATAASTAPAHADTAARAPTAAAHLDTAAGGAAARVEPRDTAVTLVDADRMEITGQKAFHAMGNVVITRSDMKGTAQDALYDPDIDHLRLSGKAKVSGSQFTLAAGTIDGDLAGNEFKDVTATSKAELDSKDLRVKSPAMTIAFEQGKVQRLVALSAERAGRTATDGHALAEAFSRDFRLVADSIDAKAPAQKLEEVVAVGHAYGERQNDSIKVKMPEIASKDWLKGDTITGYFADAPVKAVSEGKGSATDHGEARPAPKLLGESMAHASPDSGATAPPDSARRVLERIVAVGDSTPASSIYRTLDKKDPGGVPTVDYVLARRITVAFREGQVSQVKLDGQIRGMHLEPQEPKQKAKEKEKKTVPAKKVAETRPPAARSVKP